LEAEQVDHILTVWDDAGQLTICIPVWTTTERTSSLSPQ
jgi:hypothetical protein